jgi:hypothetical protein
MDVGGKIDHRLDLRIKIAPNLMLPKCPRFVNTFELQRMRGCGWISYE